MLLGLLWESRLQVLYYWWSSPLSFVSSLVAATVNVDHQGIQRLQLPCSLFLPLSLSTQQTPMASKMISSPIQLPRSLFLPLSLSTQQTPIASKMVSSPIQLLELASTRHHHKPSRCLPTRLQCRLHTLLQPMLHTFPLTHLGKLRDMYINHKDCKFLTFCISVYHLYKHFLLEICHGI